MQQTAWKIITGYFVQAQYIDDTYAASTGQNDIIWRPVEIRRTAFSDVPRADIQELYKSVA
jgi:hypothetical protein